MAAPATLIALAALALGACAGPAAGVARVDAASGPHAEQDTALRAAPAASAALPTPLALPASFAPALREGLSITVGVHGLGDVALADEAAPPSAPRPPAPPTTASTTESEAPPTPFPAMPGLLSDRIGAGFVVAGAQGLVATAAHLVVGSRLVVVKLADQRLVQAVVVGQDEDADIALLRLPLALPEPPPPGSAAALRPGDWVLAVGEPYGLNQSVVAGVVGGTDRHFAADHELLFIQTDLALNPGNSGGPLFDSRGALVGMNSRSVVGGFGSTGISLSIPIEIVMQIVAELRSEGRVRRPRLGAVFDDVSPAVAVLVQRADVSGVLVTDVGGDTPAERLGLRIGDIIVGMNGRRIAHSADLVRALLSWQSESGTRLTVHRPSGVHELALP